MIGNSSVSVVLPCYNEEKNIANFIVQLESLSFIDEIIVVDNNSSDKSATEILSTSAKYVLEPVQGYGAALITGIRIANSDYIVTVEPDGTFVAKDIFKFLAYKDDFDVVLGTRTTSDLIWEHAYMPHWVRIGNILCAKLLQVLFSGPSLSDVGCTYKLMSSSARDAIISDCKVKGSHFSPELMIRLLSRKMKVIEIPINYKERVGDSKITGGNVPRTIALGIRMIIFILAEAIKKMTRGVKNG